MQASKILVTGGNGLLGHQVLQSLKAHYPVCGLVRAIPTNPINGVEYCTIDLSRKWSTEDLPRSIDTLIHLVQSNKFREFPNEALDVFQVNIESTARLLDYAHRVGARRFIYASSGGVYGTSSNAFHENAAITSHGQLGYYLGSKLCSEVLVQSYAAQMNVTVLRFFFMYGPAQNRTMLIPRLVDNIKAGRSISLQGEHGMRINPIHAADAAKAVVQALKLSKSATFNIAGPDVLSLRQISEIIGKHLGIDPIFETVIGEPLDLIGEISSMKRQLFAPTISLSNGIHDAV
jgi:UDP-glucose 4-epimerase